MMLESRPFHINSTARTRLVRWARAQQIPLSHLLGPLQRESAGVFASSLRHPLVRLLAGNSGPLACPSRAAHCVFFHMGARCKVRTAIQFLASLRRESQNVPIDSIFSVYPASTVTPVNFSARMPMPWHELLKRSDRQLPSQLGTCCRGQS